MTDEISYTSYLRVAELLSQQHCLTGEHDELQFIIVHQAYELWFKLILHELEAARSRLQDGRAADASRLLLRVNAIMKVLLAQLDVLETMRPAHFLRFRERLKPASGFQSVQFREVEMLAGLRDERFLALFRGKPPALARLEARMAEPSLWDAFVALLKRRELRVGDAAQLRESLHLIEKRGAGPDLGDLVEAMIAFDEALALWRVRHLLMAARIIGARVGTGRDTLARLKGEGYGVQSDAGIDYLKTTLDKRCFPLLWESRTSLAL